VQTVVYSLYGSVQKCKRLCRIHMGRRQRTLWRVWPNAASWSVKSQHAGKEARPTAGEWAMTCHTGDRSHLRSCCCCCCCCFSSYSSSYYCYYYYFHLMAVFPAEPGSAGSPQVLFFSCSNPTIGVGVKALKVTQSANPKQYSLFLPRDTAMLARSWEL